MAKTAQIQVFLNLGTYGSVLSDIFAQRTAAGVTIEARKLVAHPSSQHPYSRGNLRNLIRTVPIGPGEYVSEVEETYAAAQEWGRPDLKKYSFKPYMRPGADAATTQGNLNKYLGEAEEAALMRGRV